MVGNLEQWYRINEIFLRHRRYRDPVPILQVLNEIRQSAGLELSNREFRELYQRFSFRLHFRDGYIIAS